MDYVMLTRANGVEMTVNRATMTYVMPNTAWDEEQQSFSRVVPGAVVGIGGGDGVIVQESYASLRALLRGEA